MMRVYLFATLMFHCALSSIKNEPVTWLMQGAMLTQEEATSRHVRLITWESNLSVNTRMNVHFARPGYFISCVIAASVYRNGYVGVEKGGYGSKEVRILYVTKNDKSDVLHVFVQAVRREPVFVEGNVAGSGKLGIVYEPIRNWTLDEIQDASSNISLLADS